eukprot:GEMP01072659.1.p1 GENE.GEMP01072659.1~~GEMP01072659.1.p1  ORF type:complete len:230 (+),score=53.25 GEMP01072659.1:70-759(+)
MQQLSLVKYNTPLLISTGKNAKKKDKVASTKMTQTEDILNSILPPREWTQDDQLWVQYVSSNPATRADVLNLQRDLDKWLQSRQARETGICPTREELYAQAFDELIRQVTIICAERGLLLLRVRDEIRMTICAYQSLYESSIAFGMRKALQAEQRRNDQNTTIKNLMVANRELQTEVEQWTQKIQTVEHREEERREQEERRHREEVDLLKRGNTLLKEQLEGILSAPKK